MATYLVYVSLQLDTLHTIQLMVLAIQYSDDLFYTFKAKQVCIYQILAMCLRFLIFQKAEDT